MAGKAGGIRSFVVALVFGAGLISVPLGAGAESGYEIRNCTKWDLTVSVGLTEFDVSDQQTLATDAAAARGTFSCVENSCVIVYGRTESQCSWAAPNKSPGAYILRHVHSRMIDQCSYASETLGGGGSQFYYLSLEPGSEC